MPRPVPSPSRPAPRPSRSAARRQGAREHFAPVRRRRSKHRRGPALDAGNPPRVRAGGHRRSTRASEAGHLRADARQGRRIDAGAAGFAARVRPRARSASTSTASSPLHHSGPSPVCSQRSQCRPESRKLLAQSSSSAWCARISPSAYTSRLGCWMPRPVHRFTRAKPRAAGDLPALVVRVVVGAQVQVGRERDVPDAADAVVVLPHDRRGRVDRDARAPPRSRRSRPAPPGSGRTARARWRACATRRRTRGSRGRVCICWNCHW